MGGVSLLRDSGFFVVVIYFYHLPFSFSLLFVVFGYILVVVLNIDSHQEYCWPK